MAKLAMTFPWDLCDGRQKSDIIMWTPSPKQINGNFSERRALELTQAWPDSKPSSLQAMWNFFHFLEQGNWGLTIVR